MRTVTMKDLDALIDAIRAVRLACAKFSQMCEVVHAVSWGMVTDNPLGALVVGVRGSEAILEERDRAYRQFERAAFNFLGEGQLPGEALEDCFHRICEMSEVDLLAAPARNGLRLQL
jgi:hypothetical protein